MPRQITSRKGNAVLARNLRDLLAVLRRNPFEPLPYEELSGNLQGYYFRRINIKHHLVYSVDTSERVVRVVSV